ncbi:MAG: hypothetical protein NC928_00690 [Candidatus Omnitrophica bacterium]|nr:hypothetical protein [Candidatus Omnitrophota bacterium]
MKKKLISLFFALVLFFNLVSLIQAEEITLTLDEAIAIALRDNVDILLKEEELKKAK